MAKDKIKEAADQEKRDLHDALEHKLFRDILWTHVIEPCGVLKKCMHTDPIFNAHFLAKHSIGMDLVENIKTANLEAWFQMIRDNQFDEEGENNESTGDS